MALGILEILATILIAIVAIKLLVILINPKGWFNFAGNIYSKPGLTSCISLVIAAIVLYYLVQAGITITQILAITLFVSLLMAVGLSTYAKKIMKDINLKTVLKDQWYYVIVWLVLLAWGFYEIFLI